MTDFYGFNQSSGLQPKEPPMITNPTLDLDRLEAEHFLCPDCDRFAKHMPHCNECGDPFPCRVLGLIAKARRLETAIRDTLGCGNLYGDQGCSVCVLRLQQALEEPDAD